MKFIQPILIILLFFVLMYKEFTGNKREFFYKERGMEMYKFGAFDASCVFYDCALTPLQIDSLYATHFGGSIVHKSSKN